MTILIFLVFTAVFAYLLFGEKGKRNRGGIEPSVAAPSPAARAKASSRLVIEEASVVLRRQIPVRFDQAPRSWLGGLPMMPAQVPWPIAVSTDHPGRGPTPLHFVAQVACEDLPPELWGGLGPRTGWLLLFLKGEDWDVMSNPAALQVLHTSELGAERQPPPQIRPVHDETYTGPDYSFVRSQAEVPTVWRRWPVDLVTVPNRPTTRDGIATITPENFASILYENAPVREKKGRIVVPEGPPFSWRGALYVVDSIARVLASGRWPELRDADREKFNSTAWAERTQSAIAERIADDRKALHQWDSGQFEARDAKGVAQRDSARKSLSERITNLTAARDFLQEGGRAWERMNDSLEGFRKWRVAGTVRIAGLREQILSHDLDTPLPAAQWEALRAALDKERTTYWFIGHRDLGERAPLRVETSLLTLGSKGLDASRVQIAADYYVASAEKRAMVPRELVEALEPYWRRLYDNRPHRMGGIHDPIQSDPRVGPVSEVLLFQIQTDDAMNWVWGDAGAYYVFIDTERLAQNDFTQLNAFFENH